MSIAAMQDWPDAGVKSFSHEEENRIMAYQIPGERRHRRKYNGGAVYYPRRPLENPGRWFAAHRERLRSLELAAGMR